MKKYGLIGYPLSHSFSPAYFNDKFEREGIDARYDAFPIATISDFENLIREHDFSGLNVTIPYKQDIIPYLDGLSDEASIIGAVNTIKFENGKMIGYNTDVDGFEKSLTDLVGDITQITGAMVLGTGGASKAVSYVLNKYAIPYVMVSRSKANFTYDDIDEQSLLNFPLIINTTPLGMNPNENTSPDLPYELITKNNILYDLVYNPEKTLFLSEGMKRGALCKNGYDMLIYQAEEAFLIWNR